MNQSGYPWTVAWLFFSVVLSSYYFISADMVYDDLKGIPMSDWEGSGGDLASLLLKESGRFRKQIGLTYEQRMSLARRLARTVDAHLKLSAKRIVQIAKEKNESGINITTGRLAYYFNYGWFLQVVKELDDLIKTIGHTSSDSDFYHVNYKPIANELKTNLRFILNSIEYQENISEIELIQLELEIRSLATELAADWKDAVNSTVDGLLKGEIDF